MRTLITGAPGWLGNRLLEALTIDPTLKQYSAFPERNLRCLVMPSMTLPANVSGNIEVVSGDIRNVASVEKAMEGVDTVLHLAGIIHPKRIKDLYDINTEGTRNVVDAAAKAGVRRVILMSSNSPAGTNPSRDHLFTEDEPPHPYKNYGKSKLLAEQIIHKAVQEKKIEGVIIRACWFYGVGQPARQTTFFKMIKKGNPIIFGDGKNVRSMSYIDNLVQGILLAEGSDKANGKIYWIADERAYTTLEIYQVVAGIFGVTLKPRFIPGIACSVFEILDDILQSLGMYQQEIHVAGEMNKDIACSIEKAKRELGYAPTVDLTEGMRRSIEWCRKSGML